MQEHKYVGDVNEIKMNIVRGWAFNKDNPNERVRVIVSAEGGSSWVVVADKVRPDLIKNNIGDGRHAFEFLPPNELLDGKQHKISFVFEKNGTLLKRGLQKFGPFQKNRQENNTDIAKIQKTKEKTPPERVIGDVNSYLDGVIKGWAFDTQNPEAHVKVRISIDDATHWIVSADKFRPDLVLNKIGSGRHSFEFSIPKNELESGPTQIEVTFEENNKLLRRGKIDCKTRAPQSIKTPIKNIKRNQPRLLHPLAEKVITVLASVFDSDNSVKSADHQLMMDKLFNDVEAEAKRIYVAPVPIYVHEKNPSTYAADIERGLSCGPVVSFTTISGRIKKVSQMLKSLKMQTLKAHSINMYISSDPYLLDEGIDLESRELSALHEAGVNIYSVQNIGPYRKQHYVIKQLQDSGAPLDTIILTVDDDVLYPEDILQTLVYKCRSLRSVVAHRGREIVLSSRSVSSYKSFIPPQYNDSHLNLATGRNGIAYHLGFFPRNPTFYVGPFLAPTADDLWCKWMTGFYCISTYIVEPQAAYIANLDFPEVEKNDKVSLFHTYNAKGDNNSAITALEVFFKNKGASFFDLNGA